MRLQHGGSQALYRELLQATTQTPVLFGFRKGGDFFAPLPRELMQNSLSGVYGLHILVPHPVVPPLLPSAFSTVGVTKVLRKRTAVATTSNIRFTVGLLFECESDRDSFMADRRWKRHSRTVDCSEFVTR